MSTGPPRPTRIPSLLGLLAIFALAAFLFCPFVPQIFRRHSWESVCAVGFSADGKYLAAGMYEGTAFNENFHFCVGDLVQTVALFDLERGSAPILVDQISDPRTRSGLPGTPLGEFLCFTPDGSALLVGTIDEMVKLWDPKSRSLKQTLQSNGGSITSVGISHNGKMIAGGARDILLWDSTGFQEKVLESHLTPVKSIAFSPDDRSLAVCDDFGRVEIWDLHSNERKQFNIDDKDGLYSLQYSPDGGLLAMGSGRAAWLWDVQHAKKRFELDAPGATGIAFSPDGKILATTGDAQLVFWNTETGKRTLAISPPLRTRCIAYSPDGHFFATGQRWGDQVTLWDASTRMPIWTSSVRPPAKVGWMGIGLALVALLLVVVACIALFRKRGFASLKQVTPRRNKWTIDGIGESKNLGTG